MEIKVLQYNPDLAQTILDFQTKHMDWDEKDLEEYYEKYYSTPKKFVVAYDGEKMVGCINILERKITFDSTKINLGGIGGVCVDFDYRRQGIAKKMLKVAMNELKILNCDIAYLCTDVGRLGNLYNTVSFVPLNRKRKSIGKSSKIYIGGGVMIAPVNSQEKFQLVLGSDSILDLQGPDW